MVGPIALHSAGQRRCAGHQNFGLQVAFMTVDIPPRNRAHYERERCLTDVYRPRHHDSPTAELPTIERGMEFLQRRELRLDLVHSQAQLGFVQLYDQPTAAKEF